MLVLISFKIDLQKLLFISKSLFKKTIGKIETWTAKRILSHGAFQAKSIFEIYIFEEMRDSSFSNLPTFQHSIFLNSIILNFPRKWNFQTVI